jgi:predicted DNA repair protein MutK
VGEGQGEGAIRTDFILSAEIIVLTLGVVATASFTNQLVTLAVVALAMTVFVYGLVAGIVKLDDVGLYLSRKGGALPPSVAAWSPRHRG